MMSIHYCFTCGAVQRKYLVKMMNDKARSIGAFDSNFKTLGLFVEGQYTTLDFAGRKQS